MILWPAGLYNETMSPKTTQNSPPPKNWQHGRLEPAPSKLPGYIWGDPEVCQEIPEFAFCVSVSVTRSDSICDSGPRLAGTLLAVNRRLLDSISESGASPRGCVCALKPWCLAGLVSIFGKEAGFREFEQAGVGWKHVPV